MVFSRNPFLILAGWYRLAWMGAGVLACAYVAIVVAHSTSYIGPDRGLALVVAHFLKADIFDMVSAASSRLFGKDIGKGVPASRYALICGPVGHAIPSENGKREREVRFQLVIRKSGILYDVMLRAIVRGESHVAFILSQVHVGGAQLCGFNREEELECTCKGRFNAFERSRIPAANFTRSSSPWF
jgi:hypothetical protein